MYAFQLADHFDIPEAEDAISSRVEERGTAPIVFTSGSSKETEIAEALAAGADQYLLKPCEPDKLKEIVKELILRN